MRKRGFVWLSALALSAAACVAVSAQAPERARIDRPVKDFQFRDLMVDDEKQYSLSQFKGKKAVLLTFVSYNCDVTWRYEKRLGKVLQDYGKKNVAFLGVRSSARDTPDAMRRYMEAKNLTMPVLYDAKNAMADYFGVQVTPTFALIDKDGVLRYYGSFDEDMEEKQAKKPYVPDALDAVLAGKPVAVKQTEPFG
jgi:peroxiredoxin